MTYNKFGAKKVIWRGLEFDSTVERDQYILAVSYQEKNKIVDLHKFGTNEGYILEEMGRFKKNGKSQKLINVKYTPDFKFYALDATIFGHHFLNCNVIVEVKGKKTAKLADYQIRKRLFLKKFLDENTVFLEVILMGKGKKKVILWEVI